MSEPWVIWSFEHRAWWRPGAWGYSPHLAEAGHFTEAEATRIVADANIVERNEMMVRFTDAQHSYGCPRCGRLSFNPHDRAERYCGHCHRFEEETQP